jgi:hypothetical protein
MIINSICESILEFDLSRFSRCGVDIDNCSGSGMPYSSLLLMVGSKAVNWRK